MYKVPLTKINKCYKKCLCDKCCLCKKKKG